MACWMAEVVAAAGSEEDASSGIDTVMLRSGNAGRVKLMVRNGALTGAIPVLMCSGPAMMSRPSWAGVLPQEGSMSIAASKAAMVLGGVCVFILRMYLFPGQNKRMVGQILVNHSL